MLPDLRILIPMSVYGSYRLCISLISVDIGKMHVIVDFSAVQAAQDVRNPSPDDVHVSRAFC